MNITDTIWPLDPHTIGKHRVLENYLNAWLPILAQSHPLVQVIDGFAGPGEYTGGEPGSPLIALQALRRHSAWERIRDKIEFLFIEKDEVRADHLRELLTRETLPPEMIRPSVNTASFESAMTAILDATEEQNAKPPPAFVMIDPFGFSDTPMSVIGRILKIPRAEVYISFMFRDINRFLTDPGKEDALDSLFGCTEWRDSRAIGDRGGRRDFLLGLYRSQLKRAGAEYVLHFDLYEEQTHVYTIFFGTGSLKGSDKMKKAIWKAAPLGAFRFRGAKADQLILGDGLVDNTQFQGELRARFNDIDWIPIQDILDFVSSDETGFHTGHLRSNGLIPMEQRGELEAKDGTRRNARTYPPGTELRFVDPMSPESQQGSLFG